PCIFENPSCQQGGFQGVALDTGGSVTGYNVFSLVYTGAQLNTILNGHALLIGIDINQASGQGAQSLLGFELQTCASAAGGGTGCNNLDVYTGSTGNVPAGNNGNGYADYILTGFSALQANTLYRFHLNFADANDGTENVFLISGAAQIPEPATFG